MVTREDVLQMARLSKLYIKEEELDALTKDMDNIIAFAETISTAQCEQTNFDNINNLSNVLREDVVVPSYDREEILKNAESQDEGYFLVKRRS
ncbi:MAG: Asp-tRNA(Asn)/Glu-tRNA(Gln) amidotransferase subunit GatC [Clostridium sp.]|nr:Asp-tRNA(Asn)/Glu-tRNA(Gln) amidotransferase subunit GatC [Clostridium sp.]